MAHSYTPGLKVTGSTTLRRERKLPLPGDVLVQVGQRVSASDIVARTQLPGNVQAVNVANLLGVLPEDVEEFLTKPVGMGFRQNIVGSGTDDVVDALDRRVEFKIVPCG